MRRDFGWKEHEAVTHWMVKIDNGFFSFFFLTIYYDWSQFHFLKGRLNLNLNGLSLYVYNRILLDAIKSSA
jgi:hypothetical protein